MAGASRARQLFGEPDEQTPRSADVAEAIRVFVLHHLVADELRTTGAKPRQRVVEVVDGEHDAQVAESVHRRVPVIGDHRWLQELRELQPSVAVRCAHHRDLDALVTQSGDPSGPRSLDRAAPFELETELLEELDRRRQVVDDDADVVHPLHRHGPSSARVHGSDVVVGWRAHPTV